jgi:hypothetical protein
MCAPAFADLPDPVIYLPFDSGDWANSGTAVPDDVSAVTEKNGYKPELSFKKGIVGGCLDQSEFPVEDQPLGDTQQTGQVLYGVDGDTIDTPMEIAMDDMVSFTIMGWFKGEVGNGSGARLLARANLGNPDPNSNSFQLFADRNVTGELSLIVNGNESTAIAEPLYTNAPNEWTFFAVTYDGTSSFNNIEWYKGDDDGTGDVVSATGFQSLNAGTSTEGRHNTIHIGNSGENGPWPWRGLLDELRVFVSKTDNSGALSQADIEAFKAKVYEPHCGDSANPYPNGDFNGDCLVNTEDLLFLASGWLENNSPN